MRTLRLILSLTIFCILLIQVHGFCGGWGDEAKPKTKLPKDSTFSPSITGETKFYYTPKIGILFPLADLGKVTTGGFGFAVAGDYNLNEFTVVGGSIEFDRFGKKSYNDWSPFYAQFSRTSILQLGGHAKYVATMPETTIPIKFFAGGGPAVSLRFVHDVMEWKYHLIGDGALTDTKTTLKLGLNAFAGVSFAPMADRDDLVVVQGRYHWSTHMSFFEIGFAYSMALGSSGAGGGSGW